MNAKLFALFLLSLLVITACELPSDKMEIEVETEAGEPVVIEESDMEEMLQEDVEEEESENADVQASAEYRAYSESAYEAALASEKDVLLFFHAAWCPTCRALDVEIQERMGDLPDGLVIFKTDYDTQTELKTKYGVTLQHTLVQVDENGDTVTKWSGGGVDVLLDSLAV